MKKIPTVFERDWEGTIGPPGRGILDKHHPDCEWVFAGEGVATRKLDGSCCTIDEGVLYKRQEIKPNKKTGTVEFPPLFRSEEVDEETGNVVGWVPVSDVPEDRWHQEAWQFLLSVAGDKIGTYDGTYELVGPKIQGNPEHFDGHLLVAHTVVSLGEPPVALDFEGMREDLSRRDIEGIVWHHPDGRMAKIKKKDFGLPRVPS